VPRGLRRGAAHAVGVVALRLRSVEIRRVTVLVDVRAVGAGLSLGGVSPAGPTPTPTSPASREAVRRAGLGGRRLRAAGRPHDPLHVVVQDALGVLLLLPLLLLLPPGGVAQQEAVVGGAVLGVVGVAVLGVVGVAVAVLRGLGVDRARGGRPVIGQRQRRGGGAEVGEVGVLLLADTLKKKNDKNPIHKSMIR